MTIFFTSDTHFGHQGIIGHCQRPFGPVEEMDAMMVREWNRAVTPADTVYHLGDFAWHKRKADQAALLDRLNGIKHLIVGNHDHTDTRNLKSWASVQYAMKLKVEGIAIYLSHYPVLGFREDLHFHGHQHNTTPFVVRHQVDVGVDAWRFGPVSLVEILSSSLCVTRPRKSRGGETAQKTGES